jgi:hypothetical protein
MGAASGGSAGRASLAFLWTQPRTRFRLRQAGQFSRRSRPLQRRWQVAHMSFGLTFWPNSTFPYSGDLQTGWAEVF